MAVVHQRCRQVLGMVQDGQVNIRRRGCHLVSLAVLVFGGDMETLDTLIGRQIQEVRRLGLIQLGYFRHKTGGSDIVIGIGRPDVFYIGGRHHVGHHHLVGSAGIERDDGVHHRRHDLVWSGWNRQRRRLDINRLVGLTRISVVVDVPRYRHSLSAVFAGDSPRQVHHGIFQVLHTGTSRKHQTPSYCHLTITTRTVQHHRTVHARIAIDIWGIVVAADIRLRRAVEERFLLLALNLDIHNTLHQPAVAALLVVERQFDVQLVRALQHHHIVSALFQCTGRSLADPTRQQHHQ